MTMWPAEEVMLVAVYDVWAPKTSVKPWGKDCRGEYWQANAFPHWVQTWGVMLEHYAGKTQAAIAKSRGTLALVSTRTKSLETRNP